MQQLALETIAQVSPSECAAQLLDVVPDIMQRIRFEMRHHRLPGLSVAQFRCLVYLDHHPGACLLEVAEYVGISSPSASKLVDKLVMQKAVSREIARDRRRISLSVTGLGEAALEVARVGTRQALEERLEALSREDLAAVTQALEVLRRVFPTGGANGDGL